MPPRLPEPAWPWRQKGLRQVVTTSEQAVTQYMQAVTDQRCSQMAKMGFGNDVIEAKVSQAPAVDFKLEASAV